jgi:hypothetical protein
MDFVGGALPNVMFLIGMLAIGIGLGLEFKIVEVKGDLGRGGRIGALSVGAVLIATSIFLYLTPKPTAATTTSAAAASTAAPTAQPAALAPSAVPATETLVPPTLTNMPTLTIELPSSTPIPPTATAEPTVTPVPPTSTSEPPTATAEPTVTPVPPTATVEPPSATPVPPTATAQPPATSVPPTATAESAASLNFVTVPDIRNMSTKDADKELRKVGLRRGEQHDRCSDIDMEAIEAGRGRIICQSPEPGAQVTRGTAIDYVTADRDDD